MNFDELLKKLKDYYKNNCVHLVFVNEKKLSTNNNCKMYFLDVSTEKELLNYKKVFQEYLVCYIKSRDQLQSSKQIQYAVNDQELSKVLLSEGKFIHDKSGLYPLGDIKSLGIYGELFDDFYLNIVKDEQVLLIYADRCSYNIPNIKGVDLIASTVQNEIVYLIFSEAKFVQNISDATSSLKDDISNQKSTGHITKEYINRYSYFVMNKMHSACFNNEHKDLIFNKLEELNDLIMNNKVEPIEAMNRLNIRIRFDFFAIYHDTIFDIDKRKKYFDDISSKFNKYIQLTGLENYDMEIVFIPTKNISVDLKKGMETWN